MENFMRSRHALMLTLLAFGLPFALQAEHQPDQIKAQDTTNQDVAATLKPSLWERDFLTGDWAGLRTKLSDRGFALGVNYIGEVFGNPTGGISQAVVQDGRIELALDIDFAKLADFQGGSFHANAYYIYGGDLSGSHLGNILTISNIEAYDTLRLFDLWYQQDLFNGLLSVRFGQIAADDEFAISDYAATFINGTFGWPALMGVNLPGGGPAYPLAAPGVRLQMNPIGQVSLLMAAFDGDPGDGAANPQKHDNTGTKINLHQGVFTMFEAQYHLNQENEAKGLPGNYKLGTYFLSNPTPDVVTPAVYSSNWGIYFVADQMVWREKSGAEIDPKDFKNGTTGVNDQGLGLFWRIGGAPSNRNQVEFYTDGGFNYKGLIPGRDSDVLGLGVAYAKMSKDLSNFDRTVPGTPVRNEEIALELTYQAKIATWWTIQPDIQYIIHPGGNLPDPTIASGTVAIPDALVLGIRTSLNF